MAELMNKIKANRDYLVKNVRWDDIRHYLRQEIFSRHDDEDIEACRTNRDKMGKCLDLLDYQPPNASGIFINSLKDVYDFVIQKIEDTEISTKKNEELDKPRHDPLEGELERKTIIQLSRHPEVMKNWKQIAITLNVSEGDLVQIEYAHSKDLKACVYEMFTLWINTKRQGKATNKAVHQAFIDLELLRVAQDILEQ